MVEKEEIAAKATDVTNKAIEELSKEGLDPDAVVRLKQRDLAHIASLATTYTMLAMKEQLVESQEIIKEYCLSELSSELTDVEALTDKIDTLTRRMDHVFKILDEHYAILTQDTEDV